MLCPAGAPAIAGGLVLAGYGYGTLTTASEAFGTDFTNLFAQENEGTGSAGTGDQGEGTNGGTGSGGAPTGRFKTLTELGLKDGMKVSSSRALELGEQFLGKGYKELVPGSGRYISADGTRVFRMGESDILGKHGSGPHVNFETLVSNPAKEGKMVVEQNFHIYLTD